MATQSLARRLLALVLVILIAVPSTAWADDGAAAAAEYYNQATAAYQQGDYRKAADLLDLAFGADPDLVYKYNRILALQALGEFETALAELNTMYGPMRADSQNRFDDIDQVKAQLEAAIKAKDPGDPDPPDKTPPDGDGDDPTPPRAEGPNVPAIALMAGGGVALTVGILFVSGVVFLPAPVRQCLGIFGSDVDCDDYMEAKGFQTSGEAHAAAKNVQKTHGIVAVSLITVGVLAAGAGVVLLALGSKSETPPASAGLDSLRILPTIGSDGAGAALYMRF